MKSYSQFIFGLLAIILLAGFLSLSYFKTNTQSVVDAAVPDVGQIEPVGTGFGAAVCDRIIPIGEPLERMVNLLATVYEANQNTFYNVDMASKTLSNIYANLNKEENKGAVCDWKKCSPNFADLGPEFALELDAVVKKWRFDGSVPLVSEKECAGSPCPSLGDAQDAQLAEVLGEVTAVDLSGEGGKFDVQFAAQKEEIKKLTALSEIGTLIGLQWIVGRQEQIVKDLFDEANPTEVVPADLAQGDEGSKISKTAMIQRMAAKAATMIKACTPSETEKKMILSGRQGDRYPLTCQAALENGQYWPLAWSEFCQSECAANQVGSDKCIECLKKPIFDFWGLKNVSTLARLNYKIYNQCASDFFNGKDDKGNPVMVTKDACHNSTTGDWEISDACMECLCTDREMSLNGQAPEDMSDPQITVTRERMTDNECLAWLCGGSAHNWTCCHQTPIDWYTFEDGTEPEAQVRTTPTGPPGKTNQTFMASSYTPLMFLEGKKTSSGQGVSLGSMATDILEIPKGSCIKIKNINFTQDEKGNAWPSGFWNRLAYPSAEEVLERLGNYENTFCANDVGDTKDKKNIVGKRIDIWLPSYLWGRAWGRRNIDITWWYSGKPCYANARKVTGSFALNAGNCGAEPSVPYTATETRDGYTFATGIMGQLDDASPLLKELLTCLKETPGLESGWVINSISDGGGYDECVVGKWYDEGCAHAKNSCHYGGAICYNKATNGGSMAIDVNAKVGVNGKKILAATCACAAVNPRLGKVTARQEEDPVHYHISIKNEACGCDGGTIKLPNSVCPK